MIDAAMRTLNVIGPGRVGRTLAALFHTRRVFVVQAVLGSALASAEAAVAFAGTGKAVPAVSDLPHADVWLISTPDRHITGTCNAIRAAGKLRRGDVVFHCSGALDSRELSSAASEGAHAASVHPLKTFANPHDAVRTFTGTPCVAEGDDGALRILQPAFEQLGARVLEIDRASKGLYHAAGVVVSNYLVALLETGFRCYERAGIPRESAAALIAPIVRETVDNVLELGAARALTGPIARGDDAVVARHLGALAGDAQAAQVYRALGSVAVDLAKAQGGASADALARIEALFAGRHDQAT